MQFFILLIISPLLFAQTPTTEYECYTPAAGAPIILDDGSATSNEYCCGITANGKRKCLDKNKFKDIQGEYHLCTNSLSEALSDGMDLCCTSDKIGVCSGKCKSFIVWPFSDDEKMRVASTNATDWRDKYFNDGNTNFSYPAGFYHAKLRDQNRPPVCVFVPGAMNHVIEVKVEPDEPGSRMCIGDLRDDGSDKTNPGMPTTCDTTRLTACVNDGDFQDGRKKGFAFKIFCDESCAEQSDVDLFFRVRWSELAYEDVVSTDALTAVEMFCEYVNRDYPLFDLFPSDIEDEVDASSRLIASGVGSLCFSVIFFCLILIH